MPAESHLNWLHPAASGGPKGLGTDEALFKCAVPLWQYPGHNLAFCLSELLCIQHSTHLWNLSPCKRWKQLICLKLSLLGEGERLYPCSCPKAGEREETFWHVCCCKTKREQEAAPDWFQFPSLLYSEQEQLLFKERKTLPEIRVMGCFKRLRKRAKERNERQEESRDDL